MMSEQSDRMELGWSREHLAKISGVDLAAIYLLERLGTAGFEADARIRKSLTKGKAESTQRTARISPVKGICKVAKSR